MENTNSKKTKILTFKDIYNLNVKNIPYLWEGLLLTRCMNGFYGQSDIGKTRILMQLGYAVAKGYKSFLGIKLNTRSKKVLIVNYEDNPTFTSLRLHNDLKPDDSLDYLENIDFCNEVTKEALEILLSKTNYDLVIIDPFAAFAKGDINDLTNVRSFIDPLTQIADKYHTCIVLIHHVSKAHGEKKVANKAHAFGSAGFEQAMRVAIEFNKVGVNKRTLTVVKGNYLPDDVKELAHETSIDNNGQFTTIQSISRFKYAENNSLDPNSTKAIALDLINQGKRNCEVIQIIKESTGEIIPKATLSNWKKFSNTESKQVSIDDPTEEIENPSDEKRAA